MEQQTQPAHSRRPVSQNSDHTIYQDDDGTFSGQVLGQKFSGVRTLAQAQAFVKDKVKDKKVARVKTLKERNRP